MDIKQLKKMLGEEGAGKVRAAILSQLDADRFRIRMIVSHSIRPFFGSELFVEDDAETEFQSSGCWNRDYWIQMCVELSNNFSERKLRHLIEVMKYLRLKKDPKFMPRQKKSSRRRLSSGHRRETNETGRVEGYADKVIKKVKKRFSGDE